MKKLVNCLALILIFASLAVTKSTDKVSTIFKTNYVLNNRINEIYFEIKTEELVVEEKVEDQVEEKIEDQIEEIIIDPCAPRNLEQLQGKKLIAFTFDDGPNNKTTLKLLEGMKEYDARATFFVLGSRVNKHRESLVTAYEQCNQIGNHTYNHYNLLKKNDTIVKKEINDTNTAIYNIIGEYPTIIRPPYGNTNSKIKEIGNLPTISWSIDTLDWKYRNAERVANAIIEDAEDGAIVLLHDLYSTSVEGALMAMKELKDEYAFVTIEEMAILKGIELNKMKTYYKFK